MGFPQSEIRENSKRDLNVSGKVGSLPEIVEENEWNDDILSSTIVYDYSHDLTLQSVEWLEPSASSSPLPDTSLLSPVSPYKELYDGFSGPWSWETNSLQEMEFPPTPETEPKNKNNTGAKKNKKKKKLTITGEETNDETSDVSDLRTLETLDELKARLKANYDEAKKQREKYLNLSREQTSEEKRAKSVRGTRKCTGSAQEINAKNSHNATTTADVNAVVIDDTRLSSSDIETSKNVVAMTASFHNELETVLQKNGGGGNSSPVEVSTKSLDVDVPSENKTTSDTNIIESSTKLTSKTETSPDSPDAGTKHNGRLTVDVYMGPTSPQKKSALREDVYIGPTPVTTPKEPTHQPEIDKSARSSDISLKPSNDVSFVSIHTAGTKHQPEKIDIVPKFGSGSSSVKSEMSATPLTPVTSVAAVTSVSSSSDINLKKDEEEEDVGMGASVITNDNIDFDMGFSSTSGGGLDNVMDMLSNW